MPKFIYALIFFPFALYGAWGYHTLIDLHDCDPDRIRSHSFIKTYIYTLCDIIDMKRYRDPIVVRFGEDEHICGFSMVQLIETSLISGHFAEESNRAFIDIFSCKSYDAQKAAHFTARQFKAKSYNFQVVERN